MMASRISGLVKQQLWGHGRYRDPEPILRCMEDVLTNWPYSTDVQALVSRWHNTGCHLHTKVLVKMGEGVYPLVLSETCEPDVLAFTQNDITYLLAAVIEETEQELSRLRLAGVDLLDPLAALLLERGVLAENDENYQDTRE